MLILSRISVFFGLRIVDAGKMVHFSILRADFSVFRINRSVLNNDFSMFKYNFIVLKVCISLINGSFM